MFRGTPERHEPGDTIEPNGHLGRVYAASTMDLALDVLTLNHDDGWVYEVMPTGPWYSDDEYAPGDSWWSNHPMDVLREVCRHPSTSHLWPCGCLKNDAGAHRVGCPDHPEGVRGR
jgi:hypothetical protein